MRRPDPSTRHRRFERAASKPGGRASLLLVLGVVVGPGNPTVAGAGGQDRALSRFVVPADAPRCKVTTVDARSGTLRLATESGRVEPGLIEGYYLLMPAGSPASKKEPMVYRIEIQEVNEGGELIATMPPLLLTQADRATPFWLVRPVRATTGQLRGLPAGIPLRVLPSAISGKRPEFLEIRREGGQLIAEISENL